MNGHRVILGEFENELYAEIAKRDLRIAGIKAKTIKNYNSELLPLLSKTNGIHLIVPVNQLEDAKRILKTKFI